MNIVMDPITSTGSAKSRGAFFTPPQIAEFLAAWAIHSSGDAVLEPSCGEAAFLLAAATAQEKLGGIPGHLVGVEIHAPSAAIARGRLTDTGVSAEINVADFFDCEPKEQFDAVLGNPPFIRYQSFNGEGRLKGVAAALRQGVRLSKLASAWAAFLIHACAFLKPNGRLGLVLPAELLAVNYASSVRSYLMRRFRSLKIIAFEQSIFPGVQEEVVLLLASGVGESDRFDLLQAKNLEDLEGSLGRRWPYFKPLQLGDKWTYAFIPDDALNVYRAFGAKKAFEPASAWGRAYLGCVTGANEFFLLTAEQAASLQLAGQELIPMLPPGSKHSKGFEFSKTAWAHGMKQGERVLSFCAQRCHSV